MMSYDICCRDRERNDTHTAVKACNQPGLEIHAVDSIKRTLILQSARAMSWIWSNTQRYLEIAIVGSILYNDIFFKQNDDKSTENWCRTTWFLEATNRILGVRTVEASNARAATRSHAPSCMQSWRRRCDLAAEICWENVETPKIQRSPKSGSYKLQLVKLCED